MADKDKQKRTLETQVLMDVIRELEALEDDAKRQQVVRAARAFFGLD